MIKILHMSTALDGGGVEKFLLNYYKHINRKKIHFSIIVPGFKKGLLEDDFLQLGANVYHVHKLSDNLFKGIIDIYKVVKNNEYDVVHCHGNKSSLLGIIFGFFCGIKVRIVHAHMTEETIVHFKKIYKKISSLIIDLFCTDRFACGEDAGIYLFGKRKFTIINNAIELENFKFDIDYRDKKRRNFSNNDIILCCVARFNEQKNHKFLINVFYELTKLSTDYKLILLGDGPLMSSIKEKCKELGIIDKVFFLGNRNDVNKIMSIADIGILTSLYEGLPVVLVEMQAAGLPVLCSDSVTKEVNITKKIKYIDLKYGSKYWSKEILSIELNSGNSREMIYNSMIGSKYDIISQAKQLENIYYEKLIGKNEA